MTPPIRRLILISIVAAVALTAAAIALYPIRPGIGGPAGIAFWTLLTLVSSLAPVRLPQGTVAFVSAAPILASVYLGGPVAGAIVAGIGTIEMREVRGDVPWYGTAFNHASSVITAVTAGLIFDLLLPSASNHLIGFLALLAASAAAFAVNVPMSALAVSARTGSSLRSVWAKDVRGTAFSLVGLAPVAWLMAIMFQLPGGAGWWATTLFFIPLFATRTSLNRYVETRVLFEQTIGALANAVDARDRYTRGHSNRVSHIAEAMARVMRLPEAEIEKIQWAGLLHDIGKIGIRDNILLKPGALTKEERVLMNQHPTIGAEIVAPARQLSAEAPLIRAHHEWINGSGYPDGVEALDIPLGARILTIADAYEAMTSSRPYRLTPLSHETAVDQLEKFSGIQFDPDIVPVLVNLPREVLDRPPDRPDELPTMLAYEDSRDSDDAA